LLKIIHHIPLSDPNFGVQSPPATGKFYITYYIPTNPLPAEGDDPIKSREILLEMNGYCLSTFAEGVPDGE
jgi:hypothetical protein